jgi:hypothetical protein
MEQMPVIVWTADANLRITSNWGAGWPVSQIPSDSFVGHTVYEFLGCAERDASPIAEHHEALRGVSSRFEYQHRNGILVLNPRGTTR